MKKRRKQENLKGFNLLLIIIFLFNTSCSDHESKNIQIEFSKESHGNGLLKKVSWKSKGDIEEGKLYLFLGNGEKYAEFTFKDGVKNGKAFTYYKGTVLTEENYINDKLNGEAKYYDKGKLESEGFFRNDLKTGVWNYY